MIFQFEEYTLDIARGCLRLAEREVELRPKSFDVLRYLVENAGRLVTKAELIDKIWPDVLVSEESLSRCISEVREAVADRDHRIIKTVPRRGYRFLASVSQRGPDCGATLISAVIEAEQRQPEEETDRARISERPSIAVLPFVNLSGDAEYQYFSDGITEDIITELSRFSELLVIARNSTFQYKDKVVDVRQIGQQLAVRYVLEGSVRRGGNRLRINVQLIDATAGVHRWAERYDREIKDVFAVEDEVARTTAATLVAHVNKAEAERALLKPPATWEAYDYYLRGADLFSAGFIERTAASLYEARGLLEKSISIDPNYARAYALLARTHAFTYVEPRDRDYLNPSGLERAHELAQKAVQLDGNLPQAHVQLGFVLHLMGRYDTAIAEFERALSLNPNFTDYSFGMCLVFAGEPERAIEALQANLRLDPFQSASRLAHLGHAYYMLKRYTEAVAPLRECAARMPNYQIVHLWLAAASAQLGRHAEARLAAAAVLRINTAFTIDRFKCFGLYKNPEDAEHMFDGLRKAGLPEDRAYQHCV